MQPELIQLIDELVNREPFDDRIGIEGRSHTCGTHVPLSIFRRIEKIRERTDTPYEINSDVVLDAIYLGLRVIEARYGKNTSSDEW